jgi:RNA polymerase sigma-70 factor, ECF subfamily
VNDRELVERALKGDASAFDELVLLYGQAVYRTALAALGSPMDAEDVMQDAFMVAYGQLSHFRGDARLESWLLTIAWRCAVRRRQSPARRLHQMMAGSEFLSDRSRHEPSADDAMAAPEMRQQLRRLICSLPARLRDPFLLAASGCYSDEELSEILDVPAGTLKWRLSEARRLVKETLQRLDPAPASGL